MSIADSLIWSCTVIKTIIPIFCDAIFNAYRMTKLPAHEHLWSNIVSSPRCLVRDQHRYHKSAQVLDIVQYNGY
jgi:hypothetical protein